ncbi:MAG: hypothetical protein ABH824_06455 [Nanoarchaeota archaeon]|nr:hypothetical protein [Nanoarchaeota archaeon]MBU1631918.1 hypothetical protein [Nanoarchaeota archaeon]MBU1875940.1 hypothetical protein [Nanoarchaeota archaeon]
MNQQKMWSFAGLFMIMLVLSLPFYSADALASIQVQITKNQGQAGIENYLDADGDVWNVEALITGAGNETLNPEDVHLKIGDNEEAFSSCSDSTLGMVCEYISTLTDGVKESEYAFQVVYNFVNQLGNPDSASNGDYIRADGSGPSVQFFSGGIEQLKTGSQKGKVRIDFIVDDKKKGAPSVGLKQIDIIDADTGEVLQTIDGFKPGEEKFGYKDDGNFNGVLKAELTGEGKRKIKVRAEDRLGHKTTSSAVMFDTDFVKPQISGELNLTKLGKFIGQYTTNTDIKVDIIETTEPIVKAYSDEADLKGDEANCDSDSEIDNLWHCTWEDVDVLPKETVKVLISAEDGYGNVLEQVVSKSLTADNSPPKIEFFGTIRQFEDNSYVNGDNKVKNMIVLRASDEGSGITIDGVRANLVAFGKSNAQKPDECFDDEGVLECYWDVDKKVSEGVLAFGLTKFEDNTGNPGDMPEYEFFVDNSGPKVEEIEVYGLSEAGDKNYFQSNDIVKVVLSVSESSGLNILVNVNNLVMDAETKFTEDEYTEGLGDGWQRFTEENCEKETGMWKCEIETEPIKSGPASSVKLEIKVQDTAGNDAKEWLGKPKNIQSGNNGIYRINILGLDKEENPDFWEVDKKGVVPLLPIIDLDTTQISYTRMPVQIKLKSNASNAEVLSLELIGCELYDENGNVSGPELSRSLIYGTDFPDGKISPVTTRMYLEFTPFNGRSVFSVGDNFDQAVVPYKCQMKVYSKVGKSAIQAPEIQDVIIEVPFAFSTLGSLDETLKHKVTDLKEDGWMTFFDVIHVMHKVIEWIKYILTIINIIRTINEFIDLFSATQKGAADRMKDWPPTTKAAKILEGGCLSAQMASKPSWGFVQYIQIPISLLSCSGDAWYTGEATVAAPEAGDKTVAGQRLRLGDAPAVSTPTPAASTSSSGSGEDASYGKIDVTQGAGSYFGWLAYWQKSILEVYNYGTGRIFFSPATSLYENLYLSVAGLCIPGILYNVDKAREIHCRRIVCYGKDVPAGIATMDSCEKLFKLQMCEFVYGPMWDFTPIGGLSYIGKLLKSFMTSPLMFIKLAELVGCMPLCLVPESTAALVTCKVITGINKLFTIANSIAGAVQSTPDVKATGYCDMAESIDVDKLTGQVTPGAG